MNKLNSKTQVGLPGNPNRVKIVLPIRTLTTCSSNPSQTGWVPRRGEQGPKTIDQIHKDAELEEHREQMKVQQAYISKKESGGGQGGRMGGGGGGGGPGGRGGPHTPGRGSVPQDEGWNTVPISTKNRPIDTSRLSKITKVGNAFIDLPFYTPEQGNC